ncbi:hypothetical protein NPIL_268091 [Nephila pilipes]|uniref:Uncharacterized protein n=1 Tax=Nephila pilipes TaxID=299642 RepID=A0A8X6NYU8_NEPPI|nr:hypothetical protein NPIL_268091 [Nephila pilipes]
MHEPFFRLPANTNQKVSFISMVTRPKLGLWIGSRNKTSILTVKESKFAKTKESASCSGSHKKHAHCVFRHNVDDRTPRGSSL